MRKSDSDFIDTVSRLLSDVPLVLGTRTLNTQYWSVRPTSEPLWIEVETFGGETTALVCGDDGVLTTPQQAADCLRNVCAAMLRAVGEVPAVRHGNSGSASHEHADFEAWWTTTIAGRGALNGLCVADEAFARLVWNSAIETALRRLPGGDSCDPQHVADEIRELIVPASALSS